MTHRSAAAACLSLAFVMGTQPALADVTYSDGDFAASNWGFEVTLSSSGGTSVPTQVAGGNPGTARQITNTIGAGDVPGMVLGFSRYGTTQSVGRYDPAVLGAILSVDWAIQSRYISGQSAGSDGQGQTIRLGAKQGSVLYAAAVEFTGISGAWTNHGSLSLTASDFEQITPGPAIDFSATGGPLRFGFIAGTSGEPSSFETAAYDNFSVTIHNIPAPATAGVILSGGCWAARRRRRRW